MVLARQIFHQHPIRKVRGQQREIAAFRWQGFGHGPFDIFCGQHAKGQGPGQNPVARGKGVVGVAVGAAAVGGLRDGNQQRGLGGGQLPRFLSEPGERCGADALDIAAIGRQMQVERQNLVFGQLTFQRQCQTDLPQFAAPFTGAAIFQQPRDLHGDGGRPRHDPPIGNGLPCSARHGAPVYASMVIEPAILEIQQQLDKLRVHLGQRYRQSPAPILNRIGAQQRAIAVQHLDRGDRHQRWNDGRVDPRIKPGPRQTKRQQQRRQPEEDPGPDHSVITT